MKKFMKRVFSLLLVLSMLMTLVPSVDLHAASVVNSSADLAFEFGEFKLSQIYDVKAKFDTYGQVLYIRGNGKIDRKKWDEMVFKLSALSGTNIKDKDLVDLYEKLWLYVDQNKYKFDIKFIPEDGSIALPSDSSGMFSAFKNGNIDFGTGVDTSWVTNMSFMFYGCDKFNQAVNFDTSRVTNMKSMFRGCTIFNQPVNFDMRRVADASYMFAEARSFNQNIDFNLAKVSNIQYMFMNTVINQDSYIILRSKNNNIEAKGIFDGLQAPPWYLAFRGLKDVVLKASVFANGDNYFIEDDVWGNDFASGVDIKCNASTMYKLFRNSVPSARFTSDTLLVKKDKDYNAKNIEKKTAKLQDINNGEELKGKWELLKDSSKLLKEQPYDKWANRYLKSDINAGKKVLVFTPDDKYLPKMFQAIQVDAIDMTVTIKSDDVLRVTKGEKYSAEDIRNKRAFMGTSELSGTWRLSPKIAILPGEYTLILTFTPDNKKLNSVSKDIKLIIEEEKKEVDVREPLYFVDVNEGDWFKPGVDFVSSRRIMYGVGDNKFDPNGKITKAMLVSMLMRLSGDGDVLFSKEFTDVKDTDWFSEPAKWAVRNKIAKDKDGSFEPNHPLSREEFVTMMYKYAEYKNYDTSKRANLDKFEDLNKLSAIGKEPMEWAVKEKIIYGFSDTELSPQTGATRAQMAAIFRRFIKKFVEK